MKKEVDKWFLAITITLLIFGVFVFLSAALSLFARASIEFSSVVLNQFFGILLGGIAIFFLLHIPYKFFKKYSFHIFFFSIIITAAVFFPWIGFEHAGASRWLSFGPFSFQPAEFLKIGFVLYFAAWLGGFRKKITTLKYGLFPFLGLIGIVGFLLLKQPDTGTFLIIFGTGLAMFIAGGASWKHAWAVGGIAALGIGALAYLRPYVMERIITFLNPAFDPLGAGYQITQSLIAIGSGGLWGRGFGQSVQKFNFLPEPMSDSIFAVFAEEFGFIGTLFLLALFVAFVIRGFTLAKRAPDYFSRLTILGIVILIAGQAFLNIGSMIGVLPLTGLPLPFVSHGGSAILFTLIEVGIVLNISKYCYKK